MSTRKKTRSYPRKVYRKRAAARFGGGEACSGGCGNPTVPKSIYCAECREIAKRDLKDVSPPQAEHELEVITEVLAEQLRGETKIQDRIAREGTRECRMCGRPSLPWRVCCSPSCRGMAGNTGGAVFELDGIEDSFSGHARRLGIREDTARMRVFRGMDPIEALTSPIDERPLHERGGVCYWKGKKTRLLDKR